MPFLANEHIDIPTKDILSWAYDSSSFDQGKPIYIDAANPSNSISANQTKTFIKQLIAGFHNAGLRPGDCVCIHSFNNIYYPIIALGIIGFGGIFTGTNPSYTASELKHHLAASNSKFVISESGCLDAMKDAAKQLGLPVLILDSHAPGEKIPEGFNSWRTLLNHGTRDWPRFDDLETSKKTVAMVMFSSGTTGLPKPAKLSHYNLVAQHHMVFEWQPRPYDLSRVIALPMFHAATSPSTFVSPIRSGHVQIIMRRFEVNAFLDATEKFSATDLTLVPPMVLAIILAPLPVEEKKKKLKSIKLVFAGAAPLDKLTQGRFQKLLDEKTPITQIWGMTETCCFASLFPYPEFDDTGSVGRFLPNIDVKLIDASGTDISGYGKLGELCVKGPTVTEGYIGVDRSRDFDEDGYFRTGDILWCEEKSGKWFIIDRKKELIKVRGFQVAPAEIEGVLLDHPGIADAAVIGVEMGIEGELPRAHVVRKPRTNMTEDEVKKWVEDRLAKYKRLEGGVKFVDSIPKTPSGKILKRFLREQVKREVGPKL